MTGTILWIDTRDPEHYEGVVLGADGNKYYFNFSTSVGMPQREQWVRFNIDYEANVQAAFITELLNLKFKGGEL